MADHTFADGDVLSASDANTYLNHTGGAWNSWTPTLTQLGTLSKTVSEATYYRAGRFITFTLVLTGDANTGTTSVGGNDIVVSLPITAKSSYIAATSLFGVGKIYDSSAATAYMAFVEYASTTTFKFRSLTANGLLGSTSLTAALATGDIIIAQGSYEAASG